MRGPNLSGYEFAECRDLMHAWHLHEWLIYADRVTKRNPRPHRELVKHLTCSRCGMERYDFINARSFELMGRRYDPPEGYRMPGVKKGEFTIHLNRLGLKQARLIVPEEQE